MCFRHDGFWIHHIQCTIRNGIVHVQVLMDLIRRFTYLIDNNIFYYTLLYLSFIIDTLLIKKACLLLLMLIVDVLCLLYRSCLPPLPAGLIHPIQKFVRSGLLWVEWASKLCNLGVTQSILQAKNKIFHEEAYMANWWVEESCSYTFITNLHTNQIGGGLLLSPLHKFASTSKTWMLNISNINASISNKMST